MARAKKASAENQERWLISDADFVTLLFAFFVVMCASALTNKTKSKKYPIPFVTHWQMAA